MSDERRQVRTAEVLVLLTVAVWGVNFSVVKFALASLPPLAFNSVRFAVAAVTLLALARLTGTRLRFDRRHLPWLAALGLLGNTLYQCIFIFGAAATSADHAALILATMPVWVAMIGSLSGLDHVAPRGWLGAGIAMLGIVLIVRGGADAHDFAYGGPSLRGDLLVLVATACWAGYTVSTRIAVDRYPPLAVATYTTLIGAAPLVLLGLPDLVTLDLATVPTGAWAATIFSGAFAIAIAYVFWNRAVAQLGSARTSLGSNLTPAFALVTAWLWLGETLGLLQALGAGLALVGVTVARTAARPRRLAR